MTICRRSFGQVLLPAIMLLLGSAYCAQGAPITGAWRQSAVEWIYAPPEVETGERAAQAAILYFGASHDFILLYGTVRQIPPYRSEALSVGDGRSVYVGTWSQDGTTLHLTYRVVDRTIPMSGESYPGPQIKALAVLRRDGLFIDKKRYHRVRDLDSDLETEAKRARDGRYPLGKRQN